MNTKLFFNRYILRMFLDAVAVILSLGITELTLRGDAVSAKVYFYLATSLPLIFCAVRIYSIRLYRCGIELVVKLIIGVTIFAITSFFTVLHITNNLDTTLRLVGLTVLLVFYFVASYRFFVRYYVHFIARKKHKEDPRVLLYGAGEVGQYIVKQTSLGKYDYNIIGFIDDDPSLILNIIVNKRVLGALKDVKRLVKKHKIEKIIISVTALSREKIQELASIAKEINVEVLIVNPLQYNSVASNSALVAPIRNIKYEDLLGRDLINVDKTLIKEMVESKVVLVTGAGGSIGSEISRQIKDLNPKMLLLADIDESELHDLSLRLHDYKAEFSSFILPVCVDIKDRAKIKHILEKYKVDLIFHAAAYKHVPMMEYYPEEAIKTNILGTYTLLTEAREAKVEKVVVISTDKAVNPTNVMGATKRFVELIASSLNTKETEIVCVRFGNVLGSRGSMLPLFLEQIQAGLPLTVTHKDIVRYFMAIPEATTLVFLAGAMAKGGEVMVLDMGEPVKIYDFAQKMVEAFSDGRSEVIVTGLRPGEKLYEELLVDKEGTIPTDNKKVFKSKVINYLKQEDLDEILDLIELNDREKMVLKLVDVIPEFNWQGFPVVK